MLGDASVIHIITHVFVRLTFSHLVETKVRAMLPQGSNPVADCSQSLSSGKAENTKDFSEAWFRWGWVVLTSLTLMSVLSVRPLRKRGYEMFIVAHFFVAL
jgi:hypothetical protein